MTGLIMDQMESPQGQYSLQRLPIRSREKLRAWDAADGYLLEYLEEEDLLKGRSHILLLNDGFGALSVALSDRQPTSVSDSYISRSSAQHNLKLNKIDENQVDFRDMLQDWPTDIDLVFIKIPKSNALLEFQLQKLRPLLKPETVVIAAGMVRHIHTSTLKLFEQIIGPTKTSLAKKKSRLAHVTLDEAVSPPENPYPIQYTLEGTDLRVINHANVFSREKLDIGTRFLLQHLPATEGNKCIVDLGCGNGVLGLVAARNNPEAKLVFVDESYMAVDSARDSFTLAFGENRPADFCVTNTLEGITNNSADLILNNPPFHQQHVVGDAVAWDMFCQSLRVLKTGGALYVVGNRHLDYHVKLKRLFGNCQSIASNNKFVILKAVKKKE